LVARRLGRPPTPPDLQALIRRMACQNSTWGEERMANELWLKLGLRALKTPPQAPQANAICERVLSTLRRECLDFMIPLTATHLQGILKEWIPHYNAGRPHMALGPGFPQPPSSLPVPLQRHWHRLPEHLQVVSHAILLASGILAGSEGCVTSAQPYGGDRR
jgi:transposase InsO family protein